MSRLCIFTPDAACLCISDHLTAPPPVDNADTVPPLSSSPAPRPSLSSSAGACTRPPSFLSPCSRRRSSAKSTSFSLCRFFTASRMSLQTSPFRSSPSLVALLLFSWSVAGLTTAVTNTTGYVFPALPLSRHNLPFTLPRFLVPPRVNSPCRFGCLLRPSPLCRRPHPIISGRPRPSLIIVNVIRPRAIDGDDESRPLGWFTRRFSTTRCSAAIVDCHPCRPGTPWPSLPPSLTHPDRGQAQSTPPGVLLLLTKLPPSRPSSSPAGHQSRRCHYLARSPESRQPPPLVPIGTRPSLPLALRHREQQVAARCDSLYDP